MEATLEMTPSQVELIRRIPGITEVSIVTVGRYLRFVRRLFSTRPAGIFNIRITPADLACGDKFLETYHLQPRQAPPLPNQMSCESLQQFQAEMARVDRRFATRYLQHDLELRLNVILLR